MRYIKYTRAVYECMYMWYISKLSIHICMINMHTCICIWINVYVVNQNVSAVCTWMNSHICGLYVHMYIYMNQCTSSKSEYRGRLYLNQYLWWIENTRAVNEWIYMRTHIYGIYWQMFTCWIQNTRGVYEWMYMW